MEFPLDTQNIYNLHVFYNLMKLKFVFKDLTEFFTYIVLI